MKRFILYSVVIGTLMITLLSSTLRSNGSPGKKTGSPLDGSSCVECHTGSSIISVDGISSNIPETGYIPGEAYTITAEVSGPYSRMGFELTSENSTEKTGNFEITDNARTQLANNKQSVTHSFSGISPSGGKSTWNMLWTAPEAGTGAVTFYAAFNLANGNGSTSGDQIATSTLEVIENISSNIDDVEAPSFQLFPNPSSGSFSVYSDFTIQSIDVYDLAGVRVRTFQNLNVNQWQINLGGKHSGIFLVSTQTNQGKFLQKIQIQ